MFNLFNKYRKLEKQERKLLHQTFIWLMFASILARIIPLRWFSSVLGEFNKEKELELSSLQTDIVQLVIKNMKRLKKHLPWRVKCFEEAISIKKVLDKYGIRTTLYLGVDKKETKELIAHAWLKYRKQIIAGENGVEKFVIVGFYS